MSKSYDESQLNEVQLDEMMEAEGSLDLSSLIGTPMNLVLEDDTELEAVIIAAFSVKRWNYIALLPLDDDLEEEESDVFLYRLTVESDGTPVLGYIESDEEYDEVAEKFNSELGRMEEEDDE